jgi:hypothetical protein
MLPLNVHGYQNWSIFKLYFWWNSQKFDKIWRKKMLFLLKKKVEKAQKITHPPRGSVSIFFFRPSPCSYWNFAKICDVSSWKIPEKWNCKIQLWCALRYHKISLQNQNRSYGTTCSPRPAEFALGTKLVMGPTSAEIFSTPVYIFQSSGGIFPNQKGKIREKVPNPWLLGPHLSP